MRRFILVAVMILLAAAPALAQSDPAPITTQEAQKFWGSGGDPMSSLFLQQIFGNLFTVEGAEGNVVQPILPLAIGFFNILCIVVGGLLFLYNAIVGVVQTAHEGEVLGKRWSSLWAPVRVLIAVTMLMPLPGQGGYNTIQIMVAYLVDGSTRAASALWGEVAEAVISGQTPITGASPPLPVEAAQMAWSMQLCRATAVKQFSTARIAAPDGTPVTKAIRFGEGGPTDGSPYFQPLQGVKLDDSFNAKIVETFGESSGSKTLNYLTFGWLGNATGRNDLEKLEGIRTPYKVAQVPPVAFLTLPVSGGKSSMVVNNNLDALTLCGVVATPAVPQSIIDIGEAAGKDVEQAFVDAHADAIAYALKQFEKPAFAVIEAVASGKPVPNVVSDVQHTVLEMRNIMVNKLRDVLVIANDSPVSTESGAATATARERLITYVKGGYSSRACNNKVKDDGLSPVCDESAKSSSGQGWIGAGTWYMHLARLNSENHQIAESKPIVLGAPEYTDRVNGATEVAYSTRAGLVNDTPSSPLPSAKETSARYYAAGLRTWEDAASQLGAFGGEFPRTMSGDLLAAPEGNALERALDMSGFVYKVANYFSPSNWGADPMVGIVNLGHFFTELGGIGAVGGGILSLFPGVGSALGGGLLSIGTPLVIAGSLMAFILPMLPFVFWIIAVTGYFLLVAEAIIAVNLWAIAHLRMDGEGIAGEAGRQGYYLILALVLTPILMIFGFLIGMSLFKVTTTLINIGLYYVIAGMNTHAGPQWVIGIAVISIMVVLVYIVLIERSFSLTMEFPSKVLRWIGADAPLSTDEANRARFAAMAATGATAGIAPQILPTAARGVRGAASASVAGKRAAGAAVNRVRRKKISDGKSEG